MKTVAGQRRHPFCSCQIVHQSDHATTIPLILPECHKSVNKVTEKGLGLAAALRLSWLTPDKVKVAAAKHEGEEEPLNGVTQVRAL